MHLFNDLNNLHGGKIESAGSMYGLELTRIIVDETTPEEILTLSSGDAIRFTHDGLFSDAGICPQFDPEFMSRNPSFEIVRIFSTNFIDRAGKTTTTEFIVTFS